jgi:thiosulfate/3-mercaptopyruvate sulfurtransferase
MSEKVLIFPAKLAVLIPSPDVVVIDTRNSDAYAAGHIAGAVNLFKRDLCQAFRRCPIRLRKGGVRRREYDPRRRHVVSLLFPDAVPRLLQCACAAWWAVRPEGCRPATDDRHADCDAKNLALKEAGITDVRMYFGSWNEWSRNSDLPIEAGLPFATNW